MTARRYSVIAPSGVPMVQADDDLCAIVLAACATEGIVLENGDVVVLAQKIVSKAEGRQVDLATVSPSPAARALAGRTGKDARLVELILQESDAVMRERPDLVIVRHRLGLVLANAGIDQSNVTPSPDAPRGPQVLLLPVDPDASAARLRQAISDAAGRTVAVLVIDSLGRAWRMGTTGTAIGSAGLPTLLDLRGRRDLAGRVLETSELGLADEIAAAASLAMGQADEGTPVVIVRGLSFEDDGSDAKALVRGRQLDLFP